MSTSAVARLCWRPVSQVQVSSATPQRAAFPWWLDSWFAFSPWNLTRPSAKPLPSACLSRVPWMFGNISCDNTTFVFVSIEALPPPNRFPPVSLLLHFRLSFRSTFTMNFSLTRSGRSWRAASFTIISFPTFVHLEPTPAHKGLTLLKESGLTDLRRGRRVLRGNRSSSQSKKRWGRHTLLHTEHTNTTVIMKYNSREMRWHGSCFFCAPEKHPLKDSKPK